MIKKIIILLMITTLSSCGFHIRGYNNTDYKLPFETVYIECSNVIICTNFNNMIKTDDLARIVTSPESAEVTIKLFNEQTSRDAQGFTSVGRIAAYTLSYQVQAQVWQNHEQIGSTLNIFSQSTMQYNDATIRSNEIGEAQFWDNLHQSATNQLVRRLIYFKYRDYNINEATESK